MALIDPSSCMLLTHFMALNVKLRVNLQVSKLISVAFSHGITLNPVYAGSSVCVSEVGMKKLENLNTPRPYSIFRRLHDLLTFMNFLLNLLCIMCSYKLWSCLSFDRFY
jgi:hypothetical protein